MKYTKNRTFASATWIFAFLLSAVLLLAVGRGVELVGRGAANWGAVALNHAAVEGGYDRATAVLTGATGLSRDTRAWRALGFAQTGQGNEAAAQAAWAQAPLLVDEFMLWGARAQREEAFATAVTWYGRAAALAPTAAEPWYQMGLAYEAAGQPVEATAAYAEGLRRPEMSEAGRSDFLFQLGRMARAAEDANGALAYLDNAIRQDDFRIDGQQEQAHQIRADLLLAAGRLREAAEAYAWVLQRQPLNYWANIRLANLRLELESDVAAAEALLQTAVTSEPQRKWAFRELGQLYESNGRIADAIAMYEQVLILDPNDSLAQNRLTALQGDHVQ